jgi:hypothetical protein
LPLSEKARIEVYLPDLRKIAYRRLLLNLNREFCHTFGGVTVISGLDGSYLSNAGQPIRDRINLLYTDIPVTLSGQFDLLCKYVDYVKEAVATALDEEAILIAVSPVFHATS